ncbi:hypothetical protein MFU01_33570 [Myxococcus fulvus]|uniref:RiboL-PSP-HEPN domain-containing protein n=1 Tax=Myxococcus fulvus TaxID=33 RepID=A0A511T2D5_MYXFU|nr:hypothetical protein [Myxococcus fulvus]GEN08320.1 hypothetical protein MFU01_33570 [Myxococcus fulvus]
MSLTMALQELKGAVNFTNSLIATAHAQSASGSYLIPMDQIIFITESAFLKNFIAWEKFLEQSFLLFLTGEPATTGKIVPTHATPRDLTHASQMTVGTQKYVDWANPDIVRRLAKIYFPGGHPFESTISSINSDLLDLKNIRNASAHISTTTATALEALAQRKLQKPSPGITVYSLLTSPDPASTQGATILSTYQSMLDAAAVAISLG